MMEMSKTLANEFHLKEEHVQNVIRLVDDGNTIPFIARYRKEMTGSLDDQVLRELCDRLDYLRRMEEQREKVRAAIEEQGQLTGELAAALASAQTLTEIEDLYRPFRPKRRTRASAAREKGLQPLADALYAQLEEGPAPETLAAPYINTEKGLESADEALAGAADILAEQVADDPGGRRRLRVVCLANGWLTARAADSEPGVYAPYAEYREPLSRAPGHRILAVNRGEAEKKLKVSVEFDRTRALSILESIHVQGSSPCAAFVRETLADAWDRLLFPSL
ncbi:MAG: RNA-binding transcriptional accessory protein, partial [Clostridiales bacterium]|nr:RNA-binding transcriptional accessory protein [Clostridiales bacterium]